MVRHYKGSKGQLSLISSIIKELVATFFEKGKQLLYTLRS
jgi:hypothetical protein